MADSTSPVVRFEDLKSFCTKAYVTVGVPEDEADVISGLLVGADLRGIETHGVIRLPIYIHRVEKNYVRSKCEFNVVRQKGATAFVSANGSMGHIVSHRAMKLAVDLAEQHGVSWVSVKDSSHFGAAGFFPMMALENDMIGYVCSNTGPLMAPYGGRKKMIGNNPLSYAFPTNRCTPVVVDFSCSVVSAGRIQLQRKKGEKIPLGWAIDKNGLPTDDPFDGTEGGGTLSPVGAHKGYGLALAHEISSALLTGGKWSRDIIGLFRQDETGIQGTCHSFMVIDPDCFIGRDEFKQHMDDYINAVKNSGKAKGVEEIFMPGEIEACAEAERRQKGIPLPQSTADGLMELAERLNLSFP